MMKLTTILGALLLMSPVVIADEVSLKVDTTKSTHRINPELCGLAMVYSDSPDHLWGSPEFRKQLKDMGTGMLRFPGGTILQTWHLKNNSGHMRVDPWAPGYTHAAQQAPKDRWMDIDEYIDLVKETGVVPVMGVNMASGERYNRRADGVAEALATMDYMKKKGVKVKWWHLDNEPYVNAPPNNFHFPKDRWIEVVKVYAKAMKKKDPSIKIIANVKGLISENSEAMRKFVRETGHLIDNIDVHWYWNGTDHGRSKDLFADWQEETPMKPRTKEWSGPHKGRTYTGLDYVKEIAAFKKLVKEEGHPHITLSSLEWNIGGVNKGAIENGTYVYPGKFEASLIQAEMMMNFMNGGLDMASFWRATFPLDKKNPRYEIQKENYSKGSFFRTIFDASDSYKPNPSYHVFKMLFDLKNSEVLASSASDKKVLTLATRKDDVMTIVVLNKNAGEVKLNAGNLGLRGDVEITTLSSKDKGRNVLIRDTRTASGTDAISMPGHSMLVIVGRD